MHVCFIVALLMYKCLAPPSKSTLLVTLFYFVMDPVNQILLKLQP